MGLLRSLSFRPRAPDYTGHDPDLPARRLRAIGRSAIRVLLLADPVAEKLEALPEAWISAPVVDGPRVKVARHRMKQAMMFATPLPDEAEHRAVLADGLASSGRMLALRQWTWNIRNLQAGGGQPGLDQLAPAIVALAFTEAHFRGEIAGLLVQVLSQRVMFHRDPAPVVRLHPATVTCLARLWAEKARPDLGAGLDRLADRMIAQPGWAGFWDQWILSEAVRLWDVTPPSRVATLPVLAQGTRALTEEAPKSPDACKPDWRTEAPDWAVRLLDGMP